MDVQAMRERLMGKAAELLERYYELAEKPFPIRMRLLASLAGIKVREKYMPDDRSGALVSAEDGLYAFVNIFDPPARQNFTIAHEIVHTFFPEYRQIEHRSARVDEDNQLEERLCDEVASELLMPSGPFRALLSERGEELAALGELSAYFDASMEAVAMKLSMLGAGSAVILHISDYGARGKLRIRNVFPTAAWRTFVPSAIALPPHTELTASFYDNRPIKQVLDVKLGPVEGVYTVETHPGKFKRNGKLYTNGYVRLSDPRLD